MSAKIGENIAVTTLFVSGQLNSATVYYNGGPLTTTGVGLDTQGFNDLVIMLNHGSFSGPTGTISNAIWVSQTNNPFQAAALSGADFTDVNASSGENKMQIGRIKVKEQNRYVFLKTTVGAATAATTNFGATAILGTADVVPTGDNSRYTFDL